MAPIPNSITERLKLTIIGSARVAGGWRGGEGGEEGEEEENHGAGAAAPDKWMVMMVFLLFAAMFLGFAAWVWYVAASTSSLSSDEPSYCSRSVPVRPRERREMWKRVTFREWYHHHRRPITQQLQADHYIRPLSINTWKQQPLPQNPDFWCRQHDYPPILIGGPGKGYSTFSSSCGGVGRVVGGGGGGGRRGMKDLKVAAGVSAAFVKSELEEEEQQQQQQPEENYYYTNQALYSQLKSKPRPLAFPQYHHHSSSPRISALTPATPQLPIPSANPNRTNAWSAAAGRRKKPPIEKRKDIDPDENGRTIGRGNGKGRGKGRGRGRGSARALRINSSPSPAAAGTLGYNYMYPYGRISIMGAGGRKSVSNARRMAAGLGLAVVVEVEESLTPPA